MRPRTAGTPFARRNDLGATLSTLTPGDASTLVTPPKGSTLEATAMRSATGRPPVDADQSVLPVVEPADR